MVDHNNPSSSGQLVSSGMEDNGPPGEVDVPVDWLYKGRRSSKTGNSKGAVVRQRANSTGHAGNPLNSSDKVKKEQAAEPQKPVLSSSAPSPAKRALTAAKEDPLVHRRSLSVSSGELKKAEGLGERSKRSLFGSIFRRGPHPSNTSSNAAATGSAAGSSETKAQAAPASPTKAPSPPSPKTKPSDPLEHLTKVPMRRVAFAVDKFGFDPPQQLPSRNPRRGNVLIPEEMVSELPTISQGITNTGSSVAKEPRFSKDSKEYKLALEAYKRALKESAKHQQDAHVAAKHIEHEVATFKHSALHPNINMFSGGKNQEKEKDAEELLDSRVSKFSIDKPIHMNEHPFQEATPTQSEDEPSEDREMTLDIVYTRCCHLREILPIPSTLRQVLGKSAPLHTLKFLNPRPTLIDILSFCDFMSIVPINTVIFDKVSLTSEMFEIVITSLVNSKALEKLSLRNVVINKQGWRLLCKFLMANRSISRLDISQTRTKSDAKESHNRDQMDWSLFTRVLKCRKGRPLEELLLNGVRFDRLPPEQFQNLITAFGEQPKLQTSIRLGVAASEINIDCLKILLTWMSKYKVQGVDLGFNDLSPYVKVIVGKISSLKFDHLEYFTLNGTCIPTGNDLALLLRSLAPLPLLKFLDISNLPQCFPVALSFLYTYLPRLLHLSRVHLDNNNLGFKDLSILCTIFPKCPSLTHVSMQNQALLSTKGEENSEETLQFIKNAFAANLLSFVKDSPNLVNLDLDFDQVPDEIKSRIALTLMRNMNKNIDSNFQIDELSTQDELLFDGSLLAETAETILDRLNKKSFVETDATKRYLTKKYFEKLQHIRHNVQTTIDNMFDRKKYGELPLREKENLVRLLLLEKNLANILDIFKDLPDLAKLAKSKNSQLVMPQPYLKHVGTEGSLNIPITASENIEATTRPHLMATDSGKTIDVATGQTVLSKRSSITSLISKQQEQEEGELHKWGFYVKQQNCIYPENEASAHASSGVSSTSQPTKVSSPPSPSPKRKLPSPTKRKPLPKIPSGAELREAIIKAKGIDSITDLINTVEEDRSTLKSIYGNTINVNGSQSRPSALDTRNTSSSSTAPNSAGSQSSSDDIGLPNESDAETVQETYDKLLNNLSLERPPK